MIPRLLLGLVLASGPFPWPHDAASVPLSNRIAAPSGYHRIPLGPDAFGTFLRALPVRAGDPPVRLHDGTLKGRQDVHAAVLDIETGPRDL